MDRARVSCRVSLLTLLVVMVLPLLLLLLAQSLKPLKLVKQTLPATSATTTATSAATSTGASTKAEEEADADVDGATAEAAGQQAAKEKVARLQQLLALVREQPPTAPTATAVSTAPEPAGATTVATKSNAPAPTALAPSASADSIVSAPGPAVSVSPAAGSTFSTAAADARVDKLAVLMSLFKSRGIAPPPLPLFDTMEGPKLPTNLPTMQPPSSGTAAAGEPATTAAAAAASGAIATSGALLDPSASRDAEVSQLSALFHHARAKILKLARLYQSNVLKGSAGEQQAMEKLSGLLRTYRQFMHQARHHRHIDAMDDDIQQDLACAGSLQQLADRMYALAKK